MSRLSPCFSALKEQGRAALVPFITAGDPEPKATVPLMHAMVRAGADIIELGVPFSDPMADGPVIQRANERALSAGTSLADVLGMVAQFREEDAHTPIVLMGYLNPIEVMGYQEFAHQARSAGVDGVLAVDLPPEEALPVLEALRGKDLDPIFLLAPTSSVERVKLVCERASGFVYYVSLKGVTGSDKLDIGSVSDKLREIRSHTDLPVGVGFGIRDAESAAKVAAVSDAVVVGSALVRQVETLGGEPQRLKEVIAGILSEMRAAMDAAPVRERRTG